MNGPPAAYEGHYAGVIHSCFLMQGFEPVGEESGSRGRADMTLRFNGQVYLFEFKFVDCGPKGTALTQLKARGHADKCRNLGLPVHLIGVEFSQEERNIFAFPVGRPERRGIRPARFPTGWRWFGSLPRRRTRALHRQ